MPQHALDYRRAGMMPPGYETTTRGGAVADAGMLARHEYRARQRQAAPATARAAAELELRRRRLALLALGDGR